MKRNIVLLTVLATLTLGSTVFGEETNVNDVIGVRPISIEIEPISAEYNLLMYDNFDLQMYLPSDYAKEVTLIETRSFPPFISIIVNGDEENDALGQIAFTMNENEDGFTYEFVANTEEFKNEISSEILEYILENESEVFVQKVATEEVLDLTTVYNGSGYAVQMPVKFEDKVSVISTRSNPPTLIFNYDEDGESLPVLALDIVKGSYTGPGTVIKEGNGYTFAVEYNELEQVSEGFKEVQTYFEENIENLVVLAVDYSNGAKAIVVNGVQVAETKQVGEGEYVIPLRAVVESLGYDIEWDDATQGIVLTNSISTIELAVGDMEYKVNGNVEEFSLYVPTIIDGSTYVQPSFIKDGLGLEYLIKGDVLTIS